MSPKLRHFIRGAAAAALLLATPLAALAQTLEGMIISNDGSTMVVRGAGGDTTVMLTPTTKVESVAGLIGARRDDRSAAELINGLAVKIETVPGGDGLVASKVTFKNDDLKTAKAVQAGTEQAKQRARAAQADNMRRFSQVGQFDEKASVRVLFATGSAAIGERGRQDLQDIARQAASIPGSLVRVVGHTDSTGSAAANQRLSDQRASAVTGYLVRSAGVPREKMLAPTGMGEVAAADSDHTSASAAENRRVTVYVVVSKAAEGASY